MVLINYFHFFEKFSPLFCVSGCENRKNRKKCLGHILKNLLLILDFGVVFLQNGGKKAQRREQKHRSKATIEGGDELGGHHF